ncbi:MAG: GNAT family N-acetyltransferase [Spirochaetes bacterium]|nr:GNAT family N-acetyltransferase [Spirochaetota bacterium]
MNAIYKMNDSTVYALNNNEVIGEISIPHIDFHWGEGLYIPLAGIAGVKTNEEFRSKGIASKMMEKAKEYALEKGYCCSGVSTNLENIARRLYSKAGYTTIFRPGRFEKKLEKREITTVQGVRTRSYREGDYKSLTKLFENLYTPYLGWRKKTIARWDTLRKDIREKDPDFAFIAEDKNGICGWSGYLKQWVGMVAEFYVAHTEKRVPIAQNLLYSIENHLLSQGIGEAHFWLSPQDRFSADLLTSNGYRFREQRVFMLSILDLPHFIRALTPLLNRRLKSRLKGKPCWNGILHIKSTFQECFLKIDNGVDVKDSGNADAELLIPQDSLVRIVSGVLDFWDAYLEGLITVKPGMNPGLKSLFERLFPLVPWFHPADDLW